PPRAQDGRLRGRAQLAQGAGAGRQRHGRLRQMADGVRVEARGPVTTVVLARPARRNAVDRATADALVAAFWAFDRDDQARVAVLWGEGGHFCAGADLMAVAGADATMNRLEPDGPGPMGPTR